MGPSYKEYDDVHMQNLNVHEFTCEQGSLSAAAIIDKLSLLLSIMCNSCDSLEREPCLEVVVWDEVQKYKWVGECKGF